MGFLFPLNAFTAHGASLALVNWFEEILNGQVIDEIGLAGIYGFELKKRVKYQPGAIVRGYGHHDRHAESGIGAAVVLNQVTSGQVAAEAATSRLRQSYR